MEQIVWKFTHILYIYQHAKKINLPSPAPVSREMHMTVAAKVTLGQFVQPHPEKNHMQRRITASLAGQERNKLETA
jgi:hypothetical protein